MGFATISRHASRGLATTVCPLGPRERKLVRRRVTVAPSARDIDLVRLRANLAIHSVEPLIESAAPSTIFQKRSRMEQHDQHLMRWDPSISNGCFSMCANGFNPCSRFDRQKKKTLCNASVKPWTGFNRNGKLDAWAAGSNYVVQELPANSAELPDRRPGRTSDVRGTRASSESFAGVKGNQP